MLYACLTVDSLQATHCMVYAHCYTAMKLLSAASCVGCCTWHLKCLQGCLQFARRHCSTTQHCKCKTAPRMPKLFAVRILAASGIWFTHDTSASQRQCISGKGLLERTQETALSLMNVAFGTSIKKPVSVEHLGKDDWATQCLIMSTCILQLPTYQKPVL